MAEGGVRYGKFTEAEATVDLLLQYCFGHSNAV
jgi:hypothetical protein